MGQFTSFPIPTSDFYGTLDRRVNAVTFGADPTGVADSTAAIQAAIDFAYANNYRSIYIPAGNYKTTASLYLDPPLNLRHSLTSPSIFNFSLSLIGDEGLGNHEGWGTNIKPTFNNTAALYVGTGQGMLVKNLNILGPSTGYRGQQNSSGIGIALCGGPAGSSGTRIENCFVENFYTGYKTGSNSDGLCDSNTFIKCTTNNVFNGVWIAQTQNFINSLFDCHISDATNNVVSNVGAGVHIWGGNYSTQGAQRAAFALSAMSALSTTGADIRFSATLASPDQFVGSIYTAYFLKTAHFGIIPCQMLSFNSGTNVGSFQVYSGWTNYYYPQFSSVNPLTQTDLQTEMQAATKIHAVEVVTTFVGANISVDGIHVENDNSATTFFNSTVGFGDNRPNFVKNVFFDSDPSFTNFNPFNSPTDANLGLFYFGQTMPFITIGNVNLHLSNSHIAVPTPVILDVTLPGTARFWVEKMDSFHCNIRVQNTDQNFGGKFGAENDLDSAPLGSGMWDNCWYFVPNSVYGNFPVSGTHSAENYRAFGWGQCPFWGYRPAPYTLPIVGPSSPFGSLPTISPAQTSYPLLWGGQRYGFYDVVTGVLAHYNLISNHHGYSYGQDLTTTNCPGLSWNYKGQSFAVYMTDNTGAFPFIFPGLTVKLNDGTTDVIYIVTGIYFYLGYFTVQMWPSGGGANNYLSGNKTSVITGTTIKQEPYAITQF